MRRYKFLHKDEVYEALNRVRDALLAARDGNDVEQIMKGVFTFDERMKIGRRILIAEYLLEGVPFHEIAKTLRVGKTTIVLVSKNLEDYAKCFELIKYRSKKVESEYKGKAYRSFGGPKLVFKRKEYTGFKRKDVRR
jgi:uncharacterized protein YerC